MKFLYFSLILLGLTSAGCAQNQPPKQPAATQATPVSLVSPSEFQQLLTSKPGVLLDVRTPGEYKKGHLKSARLLDIFSDDFEAQINALDRNATYYVYCASGGRSAEACELMQKKGFKQCYDMDGGFSNWKASGLPFEQ